MESEEFIAAPQQLWAEAQKEPRRQGLDAYVETIRLLKDEKGFSLREIAAWLQQRGVSVDHNAVWRTYSKTIRHEPVIGSTERNERFEHKSLANEAMPWL
jgi:hypothetical protein